MKKFFILVLTALFVMPCMLCAEEVEIQLFEVIGMGTIPGDDPLDNPDQYPDEPPSPTSFRATIDGSVLNVSIEDISIPSARMRVTRQSTQTMVVNRLFSSAAIEQMPATDSYLLEIETEGGALIGYFNVQ